MKSIKELAIALIDCMGKPWKWIRPDELDSKTYSVPTGIPKGKNKNHRLHLTVTELSGKPIEIFGLIGKEGTEIAAFTAGITRLASLALQATRPVPIEKIIEQLEDIRGEHQTMYRDKLITSTPDAIATALKLWKKKKH